MNDLEVELVDPVEYAATIKLLRRAAFLVARPLIEQGAPVAQIRISVQSIASAGVDDAQTWGRG